jgi:hypothetical protein
MSNGLDIAGGIGFIGVAEPYAGTGAASASAAGSRSLESICSLRKTLVR